MKIAVDMNVDPDQECEFRTSIFVTQTLVLLSVEARNLEVDGCDLRVHMDDKSTDTVNICKTFLEV